MAQQLLDPVGDGARAGDSAHGVLECETGLGQDGGGGSPRVPFDGETVTEFGGDPAGEMEERSGAVLGRISAGCEVVTHRFAQ